MPRADLDSDRKTTLCVVGPDGLTQVHVPAGHGKISLIDSGPHFSDRAASGLASQCRDRFRERLALWRGVGILVHPGIDSEPLPRPIKCKHIPDFEREGHLALCDGRLVLIDQGGAFIIDDDLRKRVEIGNPRRHALVRTISVDGSLQDGSVLVSQ